jgi:peroxiredoxin Q/BCP
MTQLSVGDKAPAFKLETDDGGTVSLADQKGRTTVLYFYPKDDTSGCTREAVAFSQNKAAFARKGATVIGVSRDSVESHAKFRRKHDLSIALGADPEGEVCERYGVWIEKSMYGRKYMGIDRSTFLIDGNGIIRRLWRKVKVPGHVEEIMAAIDAL